MNKRMLKKMMKDAIASAKILSCLFDSETKVGGDFFLVIRDDKIHVTYTPDNKIGKKTATSLIKLIEAEERYANIEAVKKDGKTIITAEYVGEQFNFCE